MNWQRRLPGAGIARERCSACFTTAAAGSARQRARRATGGRSRRRLRRCGRGQVTADSDHGGSLILLEPQVQGPSAGARAPPPSCSLRLVACRAAAAEPATAGAGSPPGGGFFGGQGPGSGGRVSLGGDSGPPEQPEDGNEDLLSLSEVCRTPCPAVAERGARAQQQALCAGRAAGLDVRRAAASRLCRHSRVGGPAAKRAGRLCQPAGATASSSIAECAPWLCQHQSADCTLCRPAG